MKKLALGMLIAAMAACGGSNNNTGDGGGGGGGGDDGGGIDAPPACNVFGTDGNQGCPSGQKCTWIVDSVTNDTGHLGCATAGSAAVGGDCTFSNADHSGFDNCVTGSFCIGGSCEQICDPNGTAAACDSTHSCGTYEGIFGPPSGPDTAGVCDPTCDPLTQNAAAPIGGKTLACGSTIPCSGSGSGCGSGGPDLGCYPFLGDGIATCANSPEARGIPDNEVGTDDIACTGSNSCANGAGDSYPNGCAPGFIGFYFESTGNMQVMCTGLCAPLETDSARAANGPGDGTTLGKLPQDPAPIAGRNRCTVAGRAGKANEECSYIWPLLEENNITDSPYNDTLGTCFRPNDFQYDPTGGSNATKAEPPCSVLKPGTPAEAEASGLSNVACDPPNGSGIFTGSQEDCYAVAHGCYNFADSQDAGSGSARSLMKALGDVKLPTYNHFRGYRLPLAGLVKTRRAGGIH